ncbi:MAG: hypothetical protein HRT71_18105 [Flavobacteriales bacterium]|nr:hypothetical protein [Flavobacteriales bacterium]
MNTKFKILITIIGLISISIIGYGQTDGCMEEAEIIGFDATKCRPCWGWIIKVENDTIMSEKLDRDKWGYDFSEPTKVTITVGKLLDRMHHKYKYYSIHCIKRVSSSSPLPSK